MKNFFLTLSFLNILWAQFSDPAQFTVNIEDVNQGEVAIIDVNLVKKLPTALADVKLSCETPRPRAPPSDF